jgi:sec-independent protein translocase protein TatA
MMTSNIFAFIGGLGGTEILLLLFVILLLFGAKKIPELARGLGKGIREFKDATKEIKTELEESVKEEPRKS